MNWDEYAKHPSVTLIIGDVESGKTSTACDIIDYYHSKRIPCYMVNKPKEYPDWLESCTDEIKIGYDSAVLVDDAHLVYNSQDWYNGKARVLDNIGRQRRHYGNSVVYTTQQALALNTRLVAMTSCMVFRRPSLLQIEYETPKMKKMLVEADSELKTVNYDLDYAFIESGRTKGLVKVGKPPAWFTHKVSVSREVVDKPFISQFKSSPIFQFIAGVGKHG